MKFRSIAVITFTQLLIAFSCSAQNGPSPANATVTLSWSQTTQTPPVARNCVYRGIAVGVYTLPALFCSTAPITSYVDNAVVRGNTYHYAVTSQTGTLGSIAESPYSADAIAPIPTGALAPSAIIVIVR